MGIALLLFLFSHFFSVPFFRINFFHLAQNPGHRCRSAVFPQNENQRVETSIPRGELQSTQFRGRLVSLHPKEHHQFPQGYPTPQPDGAI